jgi:putative ABC transport system substrate-binding protein
VAGFLQALSETGYVEGRNVTVEYRWAEDRYDRLPALAADLVQRKVAAIAAGGPPAAFAAKTTTTTIPVVFIVGSDPVTAGLVASINRPGGNLTGVSLFIGALIAKKLELLHELTPNTEVVAVLVNPKSPTAQTDAADMEAAGRSRGQQVHVLSAGSDVEDVEIETAFTTLVKHRAEALLIGTDPFLGSRNEQLIDLAARYAIPTIAPSRDFAAAGGLMSYGSNAADIYRQAGNYVGRILKGDKPADLPVLQPTRFELVVNLKTAKALGLTVPQTLLAIADEVIE